MSVAGGVPANLTLANDQPNLGTCFGEKGCRFQSGLACSNQGDIATGKSTKLIDHRAVVTQRFGKARQLLWDYAERHMPGGQNDASCLNRRCARKIKIEAGSDTSQAGDFRIDGFADSSLAKPFRITEKLLQAKRVARWLIGNPVFCRVILQTELPLRIPQIRRQNAPTSRPFPLA